MIGAGLVLGSLAGLELSVREHFSGYRSHTMLLAAAAGVLVTGLLLLLAGDTLAPIVCLAIGLLAAGLAGWRLTAAFRRRSGGAVFRVRGG